VVIVLKALWSAKGYSILINFLLEKKTGALYVYFCLKLEPKYKKWHK